MQKLIKLSLFVFFSLCVWPQLSLAEVTHSFVFDGAQSFSFNLNKTQKAEITNNHGVLRVNLAQKTQELTKVDSAYENSLQILIDDFNFDGFNDIAVATSVGYMGVNVFYDLYLYRDSKMAFEKSLTEVCNVEVDLGKQLLKSGMKSGPHYIVRLYRVSSGNLYLDEETEDKMGGVYRSTRYSSDGKSLGSSIKDEQGNPASVAILSDRAKLYDKPDDASVTKMYLIKGDKVLLLDSALDGSWFLIQFNGKTVIRKWLKADDLDL